MATVKRILMCILKIYNWLWQSYCLLDELYHGKWIPMLKKVTSSMYRMHAVSLDGTLWTLFHHHHDPSHCREEFAYFHQCSFCYCNEGNQERIKLWLPGSSHCPPKSSFSAHLTHSLPFLLTAHVFFVESSPSPRVSPLISTLSIFLSFPWKFYVS